MEYLFVVGVLVSICYFAHRIGKQTGSRKGFAAGRWRRR